MNGIASKTRMRYRSYEQSSVISYELVAAVMQNIIDIEMESKYKSQVTLKVMLTLVSSEG